MQRGSTSALPLTVILGGYPDAERELSEAADWYKERAGKAPRMAERRGPAPVTVVGKRIDRGHAEPTKTGKSAPYR